MDIGYPISPHSPNRNKGPTAAFCNLGPVDIWGSDKSLFYFACISLWPPFFYNFTFFILLFPLTLLPFFSHQYFVPYYHLSADYFLDLPCLYKISNASNYETWVFAN
ncbi:unnamed protein product [Nyctereutes procyonoides]|uniref:(raccoon dog) hypothetical protein n=1 Tax=Nyctereutes procyonoides TaxID=34880 RepID=A0A811Y216_NYCPR|nr:unnamed protein product [Nyctereutes procyonoides]